MYFPRHIEASVIAASQQFPAVLLTGPRQVGKTTLLRKISEPSRTYVTLDDPLLRSLATSDPALFLQQFRPPLLIDEVQYAPELFPFIKMAADREARPGLFWLTGSQQFQMMKNVTETLAGRVGILNLLGLSSREEYHIPNKPFLPATTSDEALPPNIDLSLHAVYARILRGSYPALVSGAITDRDLFYRSYLQTYIERDVRALAHVGDANAFLRFIRAAAARTGQLLNMADLARDTGVSLNTAKNWLSVLRASLLVTLLDPYHTNLTKRIVKTPKLYFLDTGLCAFLTGWSDVTTLANGAMAGAILETFVVSEVIKTWEYAGRQPTLYFYRDQDQHEIDLLISANGRLHPVEVKRSAAPDAAWLAPARKLAALGITIGEGAIACFTQQRIALARDTVAIPAGMI